MDASNVPVLEMLAKSGAFARFVLLFTSFFSVLTIAIVIQKMRFYKKIFGANKNFLALFNRAKTLPEVPIGTDREKSGILENICRTGVGEFNRLLESVLSHPRDSINSFYIETQFSIIKDQVEKTVSEETQKTDRHLVMLAIAGSTCPLLGLLGTVWGIMRAFADIGRMGQASLNVVAPGIAEALITTVWGIGVAIPAVIAYNAFASRNRTLEDDAYNFSAHLLNKIKIHFFELLYKKEQGRV
ncbi:MAG: MotA/TolQ/ExbB proton channel family protein [Fibrobacterota bacterium]